MHKENVLALADFIEQHTEMRVDMSSYFGGWRNNCRTSACIAGFEAIRCGKPDLEAPGAFSMKSLGLTQAEREELFTPSHSYANYGAFDLESADYISKEDAVEALRMFAEYGEMDGVWAEVKGLDPDEVDDRNDYE